MDSDSELLFQGGEKREKRLDDLVLLRISTGLDRPEPEAAVEAQNRDARSKEPVLLAAPALWACSICNTHTQSIKQAAEFQAPPMFLVGPRRFTWSHTLNILSVWT